MDGPLEPNCGDTDRGLPQFVGIRLPFVAQHVRFGGDDECWREAFQLLGARPQRRGGDLVTLARVTCVLIPEPHHGIATQVVPLGELMVRRSVEGRVGDWVEQQLVLDVRSSAFLGEQRDRCRQVASNAVASHGKALCIQTMLPTALGNPLDD